MYSMFSNNFSKFINENKSNKTSRWKYEYLFIETDDNYMATVTMTTVVIATEAQWCEII